LGVNVDTAATNFAFMRLARRSEVLEPAMLAQTFVSAGPLFTLLRSADHQVIYGRRGTGKTHALKYLGQDVESRGDISVYVDLRTVGSSVSMYNDPSLPPSERGTRLLVDTLTFLHDQLVDDVLTLAEEIEFDFTRTLRLLDSLAESITDVRVEGDVERERRGVARSSNEATAGISATISSAPSVGASAETRQQDDVESAERVLERGPLRLHVHFGSVFQVLQDFVGAIPAPHVWLLLDEWSAVPFDLQPLLADLLRRCLFPVQGLTVKIGAIEQFSRFRIVNPDNSYTGLEVGADVAADVDLDEFMVFGNDPDRSQAFFRELLFKHVRSTLIAEGRETEAPANAAQFVSRGFTQVTAFEELVKAAEGVPRDAINVANLAAQTANERQISVPMVRGAARQWYLRDKEAAVAADPAARDLLHSIQDDVIGSRRARAFFLEQSEGDDPLIASLYNSRVLHVIKRGVATYVDPGVRYDVYAIDYGAYVHLHSTDRTTLGLFEVDAEEGTSYVEVPSDDYRSIRRAVLSLEAYRQSRAASA
jgi:hypothetical protein